ncbi:TetR/AcrR family transcriptional regulator [Neorhodopirellula pilleata]|uniref:DNA-binding transcriptional repressor AcrR n=1 Tax=Neorhodopirellula pilleata TaxID=2714738 RepID=A0A5C5ZYI6_9BACT|nr:TetR/AcrR family transcriptional regulator [Neorhodopirellula pilleata]TWT91353.1 DNA-binding transcriptional repressor AcrR [Neorhodopirellula pilleata]
MPQTTLTPKQREIRLRGSRILDCAYPMVREGGLNAVSMDAIARAMKCTRGTIYNHFPNKEDVLLAMATRSVQRRMQLFHFAAGLGRNSRERCAAIGIAAEVYVDTMPDDFSVEQITRHDPLWQKTSPKRREVLQQSEHACIASVGGVIEAAIDEGDLVLPDQPKAKRAAYRRDLVERLVFGLWSLVYGGLVLEQTGRLIGQPDSEETGGIHQPRQAIRRNCNALLDDANWRPLYDPKQYAAFVRRIQPEVIRHAAVVRETTGLSTFDQESAE